MSRFSAIPRAAPETRWRWAADTDPPPTRAGSHVELHVLEIRVTRAELDDAARFWRELAAELRRRGV
jgi:hypothetical protein